MQIRRATPDDAAAIAAIHVAGWRETYPGILPEDCLARLSVPSRSAMWRRSMEQGAEIHLAPGAGFSVLGAQRDPGLVADWPDELHALYVLRAHQRRGIGRALLRAAIAGSGRPFSACVLEGNDLALGFYLRSGAVELFRRPDRIGEHPIVDIALGWPDPGSV